jgi:hypothetical protein
VFVSGELSSSRKQEASATVDDVAGESETLSKKDTSGYQQCPSVEDCPFLSRKPGGLGHS